MLPTGPLPLVALSLPAGVAAEDNVTAQDGARRKVVGDHVRDDAGGHRELDRRRVDDADDVARARRREEREERAVGAVLSVELDDLLIVVGALEQLDARVERPAVRLEEHLHAVDRRVEGVRAERTALDGHRRREALGRRAVDAVGDDVGGERELDLADVADRDRVGAARRLEDRAEGAQLAVLDVHAHLDWGVVRTVPELDVGVERATLRAEDHLHLLHRRRAVRPRAE
mmetsp:Transcript_35154/g.92158  ORF Transcript_35154/g.92158 Transcript_35154/m.92158 type:complete len:230 (+) Transcript_35154:324-1013(+)